MDTELPKPYYTPLHFEDGASTRRPCLGLRVSQMGNALRAQMEARGSFPGISWGPNVLRRNLAELVSLYIACDSLWQRHYFIPQDSMAVVMLEREGLVDAVDFENTFSSIEDAVGIDCDPVWERLDKKLICTFGDFIDELMALTTPAAREQLAQWKSPDYFDQQPCPTLAVFLDLRKQIVSWAPKAKGRRIFPRQKLSVILSPRDLEALGARVARRYIIESPHWPPSSVFDLFDMLWIYATLVPVLVLTFLLQGWSFALDHDFELLAAILGLGMLGAVVMVSLPTVAFFYIYIFYNTRAIQRGDATFADLVIWIVRQRTKRANRISSDINTT